MFYIIIIVWATSFLAAQAIRPIATHFSVAWSVVCRLSSVRFVYSA